MPRKKPSLRITMEDVLTDCLLSLEAQNMSPETVLLYKRSAGGFAVWHAQQGRDTAADAVTANDIRAWLRSLYTTPSERTGRPLNAFRHQRDRQGIV